MAVPNLVVVLLCILGAGAVVTVVAAFGKSMFNRGEEPTNTFNQRSPEQDAYLRRVREMNQTQIWGFVRNARRESRRMRERDGSDVEIQSATSYNGAAGYSHQGGYQGNPYRNSVQYEEYATPATAHIVYDEQPRPYSGGQGSTYMSKHGPTQTWSEVPR